MKFLRFKNKADSLNDNLSLKSGFLDEDGKVIELKGDILDYHNKEIKAILDNAVQTHSLEDIEIQSPTDPSKIVCIGLNYKDHAKELNLELPESPVIFIKPSTTVNRTDNIVVYPKISAQVDYEGELAVVIGFAPIGPFIENKLDPLNQRIVTKVNGEIRQNSNTSQMIFSPQEIISYVSQTMTLNPGDVIATGTPPGVGEMKADSIVEVTIEDIGTLKNYLIKEE